MFDIMEKVAQLQNDGYKMVDHGYLDEHIEQGSVAPYVGDFGNGYIVKSSMIGYPCEYCNYEIYVKEA